MVRFCYQSVVKRNVYTHQSMSQTFKREWLGALH